MWETNLFAKHSRMIKKKILNFKEDQDTPVISRI